MDWNAIAAGASVWVLPVLFAITLHEAAHGWAALKLGDDTAYRLGRVTFNPLRHVDPIGTVLLPAFLIFSGAPFLFGWAKPVPVVFSRLRHPKRDMIWVAGAGPATNMLLAFGSALGLHAVGFLPEAGGKWVEQNLVNSMQINVLLAVFNMLPLPPLDGGRVAVGLLPNGPARALASVERFGFAIILGALIVLPMIGRELGINLSIFGWLVLEPARWIMRLILTVASVP